MPCGGGPPSSRGQSSSAWGVPGPHQRVSGPGACCFRLCGAASVVCENGLSRQLNDNCCSSGRSEAPAKPKSWVVPRAQRWQSAVPGIGHRAVNCVAGVVETTGVVRNGQQVTDGIVASANHRLAGCPQGAARGDDDRPNDVASRLKADRLSLGYGPRSALGSCDAGLAEPDRNLASGLRGGLNAKGASKDQDGSQRPRA